MDKIRRINLTSHWEEKDVPSKFVALWLDIYTTLARYGQEYGIAQEQQQKFRQRFINSIECEINSMNA
jgi:hypothetical protein